MNGPFVRLLKRFFFVNFCSLLSGEIDAEVEKVLFEVTKGKLEGMPSVNTTSFPATSRQAAEMEDEEPLEDMSKRLEALRS